MDNPIFGFVDIEAIALAIPILAVVGGVLIAITAIVMGSRRRELAHRERIIAMEKGIAIPTDVEAAGPERPKYSNRRANGLVLTGIGLALTIALMRESGGEDGLWGLIPMFIGIGLLIAAFIDKREYDAERSRERSPMQ